MLTSVKAYNNGRIWGGEGAFIVWCIKYPGLMTSGEISVSSLTGSSSKVRRLHTEASTLCKYVILRFFVFFFALCILPPLFYQLFDPGNTLGEAFGILWSSPLVLVFIRKTIPGTTIGLSTFVFLKGDLYEAGISGGCITMVGHTRLQVFSSV
ncbi:hypothetical protein CEXT_88621 [Caerostris extrusa]|uniref:Uncharacterized protein n=1 Tax=Caerostris extrusa TaxID=172846 RepID=A0AAV4TIH4_CAEEX|nr:hypothetical protein CEXT_88621 [Caerostris extrusa]